MKKIAPSYSHLINKASVKHTKLANKQNSILILHSCYKLRGQYVKELASQLGYNLKSLQYLDLGSLG